MTSSVSSSSTGTLSSLGLGSGLDSNGIVSKLVDLERLPITQLQAQATKIQAKVSEFGTIQSLVTSFRDAARKVADPTTWNSMTSTSTDSAAVTFATDPGAAAGSYSVNVKALAQAQTVVTIKSQTNDQATIGSGTLTLDKGTWGTDGKFTATGTAVQVTIDATDTLEDIRDKINSSGSSVSASIIVDASGARLAFSSASTGAANGFRIQATDNDGGDNDDVGLSQLAYDPEHNTTGTDPAAEAQDASVVVNGITLTSTTNTFKNALSAISFTVGKLSNGSPATVTVAPDKDAITKAVNDFATAFTSLSDKLHEDTKYDDSSKTAGVLQGDATAVSILNQFRSTVASSSSASSVYGTLSSIGLSVSSSGGLTVDSSKLATALGKLSEVKKLFTAAGSASVSGSDGIGTRLRKLGDNMLSFDGTLASRINGLNTSLSKNEKRQDQMDARASLYEARLRAQYSTLDTTMAGLTTQSQYISQMITAWSKSS